MKKIGFEQSHSGIISSREEGVKNSRKWAFHVLFALHFTMDDLSGGIPYNCEEFKDICLTRLDLLPTNDY
ncbi:MAG: hypothetical protein ACTS77_04005 [Arsenophonus sp. NC-TX2-MAG3]